MVLSVGLLPIFLSNICCSQWIPSPGSTLPNASSSIVIGVYNKSIHMLGGLDTSLLDLRHSLEYDILLDTFTFHENALPITVGGYGSYYVQIDDNIYIKNTYQSSIHVYNLNSKIFSTDDITIPLSCSSSEGYCNACLASTSHQLFVIGGIQPKGGSAKLEILNSVYMLNLTTNTWIPNVPSMTYPRSLCSCIFDPITSKLYAIAGAEASVPISSVEQINTNGITSNLWQYIGDLITAVAYTTAVIYENVIFVIGGAYSQDSQWNYIDNVETIDTISNTISLGDTLLYSISDAAAIIVDDVIYAFGGYNQNGVINTWMQYPLTSLTTSTEAPSFTISTNSASSTTSTSSVSSTTIKQTTLSTISPTQYPSIIPSQSPSLNPSQTPSFLPTQYPSQSPSSLPSYSSTRYPTIYPTIAPSDIESSIMNTAGSIALFEASNMTLSISSYNKHSPTRVSNDMKILVVVFICFTIVVIVTILLCYCRCERSKREKKYIEEAIVDNNEEDNGNAENELSNNNEQHVEDINVENEENNIETVRKESMSEREGVEGDHNQRITTKYDEEGVKAENSVNDTIAKDPSDQSVNDAEQITVIGGSPM